MFQRLMNLIRGFFGLFISGLEKQNPEALLEVETENLRKQIAQYNQGLASHAGLCERLMSQVKKLETEERDLRARTAANLRAGNRSAAGQYALRLQTVSRELDENRKQLEQAETTYKDLLKARDVAVSSARAKIESLRSSISANAGTERFNLGASAAHSHIARFQQVLVGRLGLFQLLAVFVQLARNRLQSQSILARGAAVACSQIRSSPCPQIALFC